MGAVRDEELLVFATLCCRGESFPQVWVKVNTAFLWMVELAATSESFLKLCTVSILVKMLDLKMVSSPEKLESNVINAWNKSFKASLVPRLVAVKCWPALQLLKNGQNPNEVWWAA